ncbi:CRISPR system Cascade subunit CasB [Methylobacterium sp. 174MFSha1.1]|uniref:type I-E CRISPR-associated protein Cse2/CasB n=1 Tax=Methylobacterium sp. 174MFSha1.1 TaxID=1502749 RepID=UPI0008F27BAF|nr:type I-E CRISPR-associated protein Cse2/CasB [Methylobacterium sp. 174MFSha1.1]SFU70648.1 CRISPR system Cascade subunit CasB [Methylobacterium sp. 174MFSha1.1]
MHPADIVRIVKAVPAIAGRLGASEPGRRMSPGERATLRRLDPANPENGIGAVCRLLLACGVEIERLDAPALRRVALAVHFQALLSGSGADPQAPVRAGAGLVQAGLSEGRFRRFLTARGPAFDDQIPRLARFLAGRGQRLDARPLVELILLGGEDGSRAEDIRLILARDYYFALGKERDPQAA